MSASPRPILLDTNLLLLLVIGRAGRDYIERHKRTRSFSPEDFDLLSAQLSRSSPLITPPVATEVSNLASQTGDPMRTAIMRSLAQHLESAEEHHTACSSLARHPAFQSLGLADVGLLVALAQSPCTLLTTDAALHYEALAIGLTSHNFNHLRGN